MVAVLAHFFTETEHFYVSLDRMQGVPVLDESRADIMVFQFLGPPGGSMYEYEYCLVESKRADRSWPETLEHLRRHCRSTDSQSGQIYGIIHVGLHVQSFSSDIGVLTALTECLHLRDDVDQVTAAMQEMKRDPVPILWQRTHQPS